MPATRPYARPLRHNVPYAWVWSPHQDRADHRQKVPWLGSVCAAGSRIQTAIWSGRAHRARQPRSPAGSGLDSLNHDGDHATAPYLVARKFPLARNDDHGPAQHGHIQPEMLLRLLHGSRWAAASGCYQATSRCPGPAKRRPRYFKAVPTGAGSLGWCMTDQVVGIASNQRFGFQYARTPGDTPPHPHLSTRTRPELRLPRTPTRRETLVPQASAENRGNRVPSRIVTPPGRREVMPSEGHRPPARGAQVLPGPKVLVTTTARHAYIVDLVDRLGVPAHVHMVQTLKR